MRLFHFRVRLNGLLVFGNRLRIILLLGMHDSQL